MQLGGVHSTRQLSRHEPVLSWGFHWTSRVQSELGGNSGKGLRKFGAWERGCLTPAGSRRVGRRHPTCSSSEQAHTRCVMHSRHLADSSNAPALGALGGQGRHVEDGLRHVTGANGDT